VKQWVFEEDSGLTGGTNFSKRHLLSDLMQRPIHAASLHALCHWGAIKELDVGDRQDLQSFAWN
jgi:hypothetical protein